MRGARGKRPHPRVQGVVRRTIFRVTVTRADPEEALVSRAPTELRSIARTSCRNEWRRYRAATAIQARY